MRKGFTLLELIIVLIIIGILGTFGFLQYTRVIERSRVGEAKSNLGMLRTMQYTYYQEHGSYSDLTTLGTGLPAGSCTTQYYFSYDCDSSTGRCTASRCTSGGKEPDASATYNVYLNLNGSWGGTAGYY